MENVNNEELYSTKDIYCAATLITLKFYMLGIDYQIEGDKLVGYFSFKQSPELETACQKYYQGQLSIEPRQYIYNWKALKSQTENTYKSPKTDKSKFKKKGDK